MGGAAPDAVSLEGVAAPSPSPDRPELLVEFERLFRRWARKVERRRSLRQTLSGMALGLALGLVLAALCAWLGHGDLRPWTLTLGALGALAGAVFALRRRWSDDDVALYLDAKLGTGESVVTAAGIARSGAGDDPALAFVVRSATSALKSGDPRAAKPRVLRRLHALIPIAAGGIVALSLLPLPKAPAPPRAPGSDLVKLSEVRGLEVIAELEDLRAKNPEQEARLERLAERARRLQAALKKGMERREALAQISRLRDEVAAERLKLTDAQGRPGLEAALSALEQSQALSAAKRALGEGDLTAFDREMQKLANQAEQAAREAAKEALEQAAKAAREKGAKDLAGALDEQRSLFDHREARGKALRELAEALRGKLDPEALEELREFGESGSPEAQRKLAEALGEALEGLSEEERKRLGERLQRKLEGKDAAEIGPMTKQQIEDLARRLASDEGRRELEEQLRELARAPESSEAERERRLGEAERGGAEAQRELGAVPLPMAGGPGSTGGPGPEPGQQPSGPNGASGPGSKKDTGTGDHAGSTPEVAGGELRAKARATLNPGLPLHAPTLGHAPGRPGQTANQRGTGSLGSVAGAEVGAVEQSDIPEEYREHVGRYFEP